jgi:hypothetical protein
MAGFTEAFDARDLEDAKRYSVASRHNQSGNSRLLTVG